VRVIFRPQLNSPNFRHHITSSPITSTTGGTGFRAANCAIRQEFCRPACATLPFCERTVNVERQDISPVWTRSFPVSKQPKTIGEHLRKQRFSLGIRQSEAARRLRVSQLTLSLWERDKVYPTWANQPRLVKFLGCDPFTNPTLGGTKGNETPFVAILARIGPLTLGQGITKRRIELRKNRKECARELGVSVKTLWGWETGQRQPTALFRKGIEKFLEVGPANVKRMGDF
jgi:transcriptional regulator with XRE-family HTH domain